MEGKNKLIEILIEIKSKKNKMDSILKLIPLLFTSPQLDIVEFIPSLLYFGYTALMVLSFWLLTGTIGFYAAYMFIRKIYAAVKIDWVVTVAAVLVVFGLFLVFCHILVFLMYIFFILHVQQALTCVSREGEGCFLRRISPTHRPHGKEQQGGRAKPAVSLSPSPLASIPPLLFPGQRPRGNSPLMGQLMSSAVSPCAQHSGPKLVKRWFLHIFVLSFPFCYASNLSRFLFCHHVIYFWLTFFQSSSGKLFSSDLLT